MATSEWLLPGITQRSVKTDRLEIAYLEAGNGSVPVVLVHGNTASSLFFQDFMLALAATGRYRIYAPDLRGYGDTEAVQIDATRGMRDFSDDVFSLTRALGLGPLHLFGWSMGGNVVMQFAIDHADRVLSLSMEAVSSPFGFGGTKGANGEPIWPDFAGSGGGTANPVLVQNLGRGDRGSDQFSPRTVMNTIYFKPPFRVAPDREEIYVTSMLSCKVNEGIYPGDMTPSHNWPNVAPGTKGTNNSFSPKYMNQADLATIYPKPAILWIRGEDDQIVSDTSLADFGFLGQIGAVPGWPGADVYPPQPMIAQIRTVMDNYRANGGEYREVVLADCGHSPHIEMQNEVFRLFTEFMEGHQ